MKTKNALFLFLFISSILFLFNACSDATLLTETATNGIENNISPELANIIARVPNPVSKNPVVRKQEGHFIELSERIPGFAGYYLEPQNDLYVRDDKLIIRIQDKGNVNSAIRKVRAFVNERFGGARH